MTLHACFIISQTKEQKLPCYDWSKFLVDSQKIFLAENGSEVTSESPAAVGMGMNMPIPDPVKVKVNHLV